MSNKAFVKTYIEVKYPNPRTAPQMLKRIEEVVDIFERNSIINPTDADFDNILKPTVEASKGKKKGEPASNKTIKTYLSMGKDFYKWLRMKGDNQMTDNEISTTETQQFVEVEQVPTVVENAGRNEMPADNQENKTDAPKITTGKVGRPVTNGRTEKVSFYLTKETKQQLEALKMYDGIELQDLLNEAIQVYFETRADDMRFLKEQEKAREERKRRHNKSN